jgi:hypothetical protein
VSNWQGIGIGFKLIQAGIKNFATDKHSSLFHSKKSYKSDIPYICATDILTQV